VGDLGRVQILVRQQPKLLNVKDQNGWQPIHEGTER
jgi:hypothetical protein